MDLFMHTVPRQYLDRFMLRLSECKIKVHISYPSKLPLHTEVYIKSTRAWNHYLTGYLDGLQDAHRQKDA